MLPLRAEGVVARLGVVGDEWSRWWLGLALVVVVGDPLDRERLRAGNGAGGREHAFVEQRGRGDGLHRRTRCHCCGEREVVETGIVSDYQDLASRWLDDDHRAVLVPADGSLGSPLSRRV